MSISDLLSMQNPDGGWGYRNCGSSTEPTALAALALASAARSAEYPTAALRRGIDWLHRQHSAEGGWRPTPEVEATTWVTSLVLLLPPDQLGQDFKQGIDWLLSLQGEETTTLYRLKQRLHRMTPPSEQAYAGWPWFPGAAAWVCPTATAVLALRKVRDNSHVAERVEQGRQFLLARTCADGGWNHGSVRALGIEGDSYPESTGLALLALADLPASQLSRSTSAALRHSAACNSAEADAWLRLALQTRGIRVPPNPAIRTRNARDLALQLLSNAPGERNPFL
jgi:hypothetical protein